MKVNSLYIKNTVFIVFFICIILLSGCQIKTPVIDDWENEVLLASECGMDGLRCCEDDPQCKYGQSCCVNPSNSLQNYCADDCTLGRLGSYCRIEAPLCDQGLACADNHCHTCGGEDQPCCSGDTTCNNELVCHKDKCVVCGEPGNPCCLEGIACLDQERPNIGHAECRNEVCVYCGFNGKVSCEIGPACLKNNLYNNGKCLFCGELNKPCCDPKTNDYACNPDQKLKCELGFCNKP